MRTTDYIEISRLSHACTAPCRLAFGASDAKLDNMVHVGHNVTIGRDVVIAAQTGVAGSSSIETNVVVAGQVGVADRVRIEEGAITVSQPFLHRREDRKTVHCPMATETGRRGGWT